MTNSSIDKTALEALRTRYSWIDALIAACLRENGCKATELELVEVLDKTEVRWFLRKRAAPPLDFQV